MKHSIRIDIGNFDCRCLKTDSDYETAAIKIMPKVLSQVGETAAEALWSETQKAFGKSKFVKLNTSSSDKRKFIQDSADKYKRSASTSDKQKIKSQIVELLRERKTEQL